MAKTLQQLYGEVMASEALKKEYLAAANDGKTNEFLSSHDCDATAEQLDEFLKNPANLPQGEITDDELDSVAGGTCYKQGRPVVTILNSCDYWTCDECGGTETEKIYSTGYHASASAYVCVKCRTKAYCMNCQYCHYEDALWQCYNPKRKNN
jgi:hypothetical protein